MRNSGLPRQDATTATPTATGPGRRWRGDGMAGLIDSLLLIMARVGANLLALAWTMLLVRMIQPDLSGIAFRAIAIAQIGSILLTLNVESGSVRTLVPAIQAGRTDRAATFMRFNARILVLALPLLLVAALTWQLLGTTEGGGPLSLAIAAGMAACALARMTARHATALGVMRKGLLPRLLTGPLVMTAGLGLGMLTGIVLRPWHVAALYALSEVLTVIIQRRLLRDAFAQFRGRSGPASEWRDWLGLGLWLTPGLLMTEYRKALLIAAAGIMLAPAQLSLFAVAYSVINIMNFAVAAVDVAFSPRIAHAMVAVNDARRDRLLALSAAIKLAGLALGSALLLVLGPRLLALFGADYLAAWPALLTLLLLPAGSVLCGPASVVLSSRGQGRADFAGNIVGAAGLVAAILTGAWLGGLTGAALGTAAGHLVAQAMMAAMCRRLLGIDTTLACLRHLLPLRRTAGMHA